ncbi:flagellar hook-associated protein FlgK [Salinarimonas rosea]|uniref:flagellar hook-associated protein FlgK n=1 Tax=Salinarimonas rosea TaxID=552063 RepID=UPI0003F84215|nr:flagellar hook-associated protein FlgK [Salinarimonas rosea]
MSLSLALNSAQTALSVTSQQTAITARNITGANDPAYARKTANVATSGLGSTYIASIGRAQDQALYTRMLEARSDAAARTAHLDGLERLAQTIGDPQDDFSVAGALGAFQNALQMHADGPSDPILAGAVLGRAQDLAERLNLATKTVQAARATADGEMATSVDTINDLLARFETVNRAVVAGTAAGTDVTDHLDTRAEILGELSREIGVTTITRRDNDMVIYTDSGVTLFEKTARPVTFERTFAYDAGIDGRAVFADGVPITGPNATMAIESGALFGHATLRDETSGVYQKQLDEIARGLVLATAETDQINDPPILAAQAGLFTWDGGPALPPGTTAIDNLSARIRVNPGVDPGQGGDLTAIRDGGINGAAYDYNPADAASYSGRLQGLLGALDASQPFDATAGVNPDTTLARFAAGSVGWLEAARKQADAEAAYQTTFLERTQESLSNVTGVNLDEELALMLELERSYGASARIISAVDAMLASLLQAVR